MLEHNDIKQLISLYFDDEATPEQKDIVEEHVLGCDACKTYYQQLSQIRSSILSIPEENLSPDLEHKIKHGLATARNQEEETMKNQNVWPSIIKGSSVFVVVLLISVVTIQNYTKRGFEGRLKSIHSSAWDNGDDFNAPINDYSAPIARIKEIQLQQMPTAPTSAKPKEAQLYAAGSVSEIVSYEEKQDVDKLNNDLAKVRAYDTKGTENGAMQSRTIMASGGKREEEAQKVARVAPTAPAQSEQYEPYYVDSSYTVVRDAEKVSTISVDGRSRTDASASAGYAVPQYDLARQAGLTRQYPASETETYPIHNANRFLAASDNPLSTFSIDVDTASYSNVRRFLNNGQLPPSEAVRIEEMINYFKYDYPKPSWNDPFSITTEVSQCPWQPNHQLVLIGLQGKVPDAKRLPPSNLVYLIDVSGSMAENNKLPLLKRSLLKTLSSLRPEDRISIVTYSNSASVMLNAASGSEKARIQQTIQGLFANGSTAGWYGLQLAYEVAQRNFIHNGNNRVILATDGDFNVGPSSDAEIVQMIETKRSTGVFLTVLGFGTGNLKDSKLVNLADKGNGQYSYIDTDQEAEKVLGRELGSNLFTIAKDVKIQVEFNPAAVKAYRLVGYEKRALAKEDFNNDAVDAGELGAGHTVTALYEVIPVETQPWIVYRNNRPEVDPLKYQKVPQNDSIKVTGSRELMTVKLRYKEPNSDTSRLLSKAVGPKQFTLWPESNNFRWAAAVAEFGLLLANSPYEGQASYEHVLNVANAAVGNDREHQRSEFLNLVRQAQSLDNRPAVIYYDEEYLYTGHYEERNYPKPQEPVMRFK